MAKKKKFIVLARRGDIGEKGVVTGRGHRKFRNNSALWLSDEGEAREVEQKYKGKVAVTEDQQYTWSQNNEGGNGTRMDNIHNYTFHGVDMRGIRTTRDNGYVWAYVGGGRQRRMKREEAEREGYEIVPQKRKDGQKAEVQNATN